MVDMAIGKNLAANPQQPRETRGPGFRPNADESVAILKTLTPVYFMISKRKRGCQTPCHT
jgi:hypothetical protein